jgi:hypothetical protein
MLVTIFVLDTNMLPMFIGFLIFIFFHSLHTCFFFSNTGIQSHGIAVEMCRVAS